VKELAEACGEFYVCERWLGGMLTNLNTVRKSVKKLEKLERDITNPNGVYKKKELSLMGKDQIKLDKNLSGVRSMRKLPGLLIVVDPMKEHIAVAEANKLGIPVMALVDTNCDPDPIQHIIACNDDALKSVKLILSALAQAVIDKKNELKVAQSKGDEEEEEEDAESYEVSEEEAQKANEGA
ncbi:MAG: 30S ribosomal protein S2, partial [Parachlamydiaceae bacterium]